MKKKLTKKPFTKKVTARVETAIYGINGSPRTVYEIVCAGYMLTFFMTKLEAIAWLKKQK